MIRHLLFDFMQVLLLENLMRPLYLFVEHDLILKYLKTPSVFSETTKCFTAYILISFIAFLYRSIVAVCRFQRYGEMIVFLESEYNACKASCKYAMNYFQKYLTIKASILSNL